MCTGYLCACCTQFAKELLTRCANIGVETWWAWQECLFTIQGNFSLLLHSFRSSPWMDFRIHKSPAQVTMLHAGIFLEGDGFFPLSTDCLPLMRGALCFRFKNFESWWTCPLYPETNKLHRRLAFGIPIFSIQPMTPSSWTWNWLLDTQVCCHFCSKSLAKP